MHAAVWAVMVSGAGLVACSDSREHKAPEVFIQVNESMVTVDAFLREVDEVLADVAADEDTNGTMTAAVYLRTLNQVTERLILFERAKELGIQVEDRELDAKVAALKADYPRGEFDRMLLEQAVSYTEWKSDLRTRLLMHKVIDRELAARVRVTPEEISAYYEAHYASSGAQSTETPDTAGLETTILQQVRNAKKEALYRDWLDRLKQRYTIHINQAAWDRIVARPESNSDRP